MSATDVTATEATVAVAEALPVAGAGAVADGSDVAEADDADALSLVDLEGQIGQRLDGLGFSLAAPEQGAPDEILKPERLAFAHRIFETYVVELNKGHAILFA